MTADFSRVARAYRWMEYASFGPLLEQTRFLHIAALRNSQRVLILGDGDGRFLARLLAAHPHLSIDSVDCSGGMIRLAQARVAALKSTSPERVQWHHADALTVPLPHLMYDAVVTHFFLDCFGDADLRLLIEGLLPRLSRGALWINSDFTIPARGWMRWPSRIIVRSLYAAFFLLAGLRTQRLPDDASALEAAGLILENRTTLAAGLLKSEIWRAPLL